MSTSTATHTGTIKFFNEVNKYGFITPEGGGKEIFFHISGCNDKDLDRNCKDCEVEFDVFDGKKGPEAKNIEIIGE